MKRSILSLVVASLLFGCHTDHEADVVTPEPPPPVTDPDIEPELPDIGLLTYQARLQIQSKAVQGNVICDGQDITETGFFTISEETEAFSCYFGNIELGAFTHTSSEAVRSGEQPQEQTKHFDLANVLGGHTANAAKLLNKISTCSTEPNTLCLDEINSFDLQDLYRSDDQAAINAFLNPVVAEEGEQPSAHVDPDLAPSVTEGADNNLTGDFVSANAEATYEYVPTAASKPLTTSTLTDANGLPLAGIEYFSQSARGITNEKGEFEYLWGENLIFGIDTFTLGNVKGNKVNYQLTDLSDNELVKQNLQSLITRYAVDEQTYLRIDDNVREVFAQYPNAINELIKLTLPNGAYIEGTEFMMPNEFEQQFEQGLTQLIDIELKQEQPFAASYRMPRTIRANGNQYVTDSLQAIYQDVSSVHIFHDNLSWGAAGVPRAMRSLNLTNEAFPVLMPRNDNNFWLPYGEEAAWTRGSGSDRKAYIVDATTIKEDSEVIMQRPEVMSNLTATYNLPAMTAGLIGDGKVVFLGNAMYTSVISCPDNYWASNHLGIDTTSEQCRYQTPHNPEAQANDVRNDHGDMLTLFKNMLTWLNPEYQHAANTLNVATNIELGHAFRAGHKHGQIYNFFADQQFNFSELTSLGNGDYHDLDPQTTPVLLLQTYEIKIDGYDSKNVVSDISKPKLSEEDITDLIRYVNSGGNIIFFDAIEPSNPAPIARLADAAGVSIGGANVAKNWQALCGDGYWCHASNGVNVPNLHAVTEYDLVVYERYAETDKITINANGTISWPGPVDMPKLEIPTYPIIVDEQEKQIYAFHEVRDELQKQAKIAELQNAFPSVPLCKDPYQYEVNCIEVRKGHGIPSNGNYRRPDQTRYEMSPEIVSGMVKAANLGANIDKLLSHELYFRSEGAMGARLSKAELTSTYDNLSVWLWNDEPYGYNPEVQDELGFKRAVEMLNCYTEDRHQNGRQCEAETRALLTQYDLLTDEGELNPSYPLNWMEKPLTRMMLGRSYWDLDISVDTTAYPGRPMQASGTAANADIHTHGKSVVGTAGNMQSTGLWAPQRQNVTISGGVKAAINVALVDDLTGRQNHELSLKRPPRVQKTFRYDGSSLTFQVPYGGLIYIQPLEKAEQDIVTFKLDGVMTASWWKEGDWKHALNTDVPMAEVDTGDFIYTTPVNNLTATDLPTFSAELSGFADHASDFYGRDEVSETGAHRRFTYDQLPGHRHRFVNDVQISIGAAHSGYPVQSNSYNANATTVPTKPTNDWLLWHEVGHNLAAAPFTVAGSTEVTNNLLALYMQEQRVDNPVMDRVSNDLKKISTWLGRYESCENSALPCAWSQADNAMKLAMFAQLKLWAEDHFALTNWYPEPDTAMSIYGDDQGWNLFKLAHRKTRGDDVGDALAGRNGTNYCSSQATGLSQGDLLMTCFSYLSGYDLSDYFVQWNPSQSKADLPNGEALFQGGITAHGLNTLEAMALPKPETSPIHYIKVQ